jgi:hypothetical protein
MTVLRMGSLAAVVAVLGLGLAARADDPPPPTRPTVLFDGKTLDGWIKADFASSGPVEVKDGAIVMTEGEPMTGLTSTRKDLPKTDYELTYEARRTAGQDFFAAATIPVGDEFVTFVNGGWGSTVTGLSSINGADASENPTTTWFEYKDNTWYTFRIRVTDQVIRCWIDDKQIIDFDRRDVSLGLRLETYANRPLGFATYRTTGELRKVEVRKLTTQEVADTKPPEEP